MIVKLFEKVLNWSNKKILFVSILLIIIGFSMKLPPLFYFDIYVKYIEWPFLLKAIFYIYNILYGTIKFLLPCFGGFLLSEYLSRKNSFQYYIKGDDKMTKKVYQISDIDDYQNRLTEEQKEIVIKHCNRYEIYPNICAWYDDWKDFCFDWCDGIGLTEAEAKAKVRGGDKEGEFLIFPNGEIVRFVW